MTTPVLLITFNRPEMTQRVLEALRAYQPERLYVFQDGARGGNATDQDRCAEVRQVVDEMVDWGCDVQKYYSEVNLGCGPGPATALTWFFGEVDEGIVLEDDAVPHPHFFQYCSELLERYRDDGSVMAIGSMNVDTRRWGDGSYYFSMMNRNLCAWATWRRAWERFDLRHCDVTRRQLSCALRRYGCGMLEREYWCDRLDEVHHDGVGGTSWDMQFLISIWLHHGRGIVPNTNLSSNIGTVVDATHAMTRGNIIDNRPSFPILPLLHPTEGTIQREADREFHFRYFEIAKARWGCVHVAYYLLNKRLKRIVGHQGPWRRRK